MVASSNDGMAHRCLNLPCVVIVRGNAVGIIRAVQTVSQKYFIAGLIAWIHF